MVKKIKIKDQHAQKMMATIASSLNAEWAEDNREFSINLPEEIGHGYIKAYDFDHGITVYEFDCTLSKVLHLVLEEATVQPLLILFNREDEVNFEGSESGSKTIKHLESVISSEGLKGTQTLTLDNQDSTCFFLILLNRKDFEAKIDDFLEDMKPPLSDIFRDVNGINPFYHQGYFSLDIAQFMEEFTTTSLTGFMRYVFLEGKVFEILTHFLKQYLDDSRDPNGRKIPRINTVEKIEEASNIVKEEMAQLGSILSLAKRVGLNQNTLQEGFKQLYNKSVNQFIQEVRMDKAKDLIESTEDNITEITYKIGINSRSYFSKLFKERFGISPKDYVTKHRSSEGDKSA